MVEAETKLKTEVTRIKKKLQIQITELEMSLDVANKNNIELQKTIKKQSLHLTVKLRAAAALKIRRISYGVKTTDTDNAREKFRL